MDKYNIVLVSKGVILLLIPKDMSLFQKFKKSLQHYLPDQHPLRKRYTRCSSVKDFLLHKLLHKNYSRNMTIIGITGTDGKTSTCMFTAQLLENVIKRKQQHRQKKTTDKGGGVGLVCSQELRNGKTKQKNTTKRTTPSASFLWKFLKQCADNHCTHVVIEVSSHALSQRRTIGIDFDIVLLTNLSQEHGDYYPSMKKYAQAKAKLFRKHRVAILPGELPPQYKKYFLTPSRQYEVSPCADCPSGTKDTLYYHITANTLEYTQCRIYYEGEDFAITLPFPGQYHAQNVANSMLVSKLCGGKMQDIVVDVPSLCQVSGRMHPVVSPSTQQKGIAVFVDFAVTPQALRQTLITCQGNEGKVWLVFGCTGGNHDHIKRPEMGRVAQKHADHIIFTEDESYGESFENIVKDTFPDKKNKTDKLLCIPQRKNAIGYALDHAQQDDVILITGMGDLESRNDGEKEIQRSDIEVVRSWRE